MRTLFLTLALLGTLLVGYGAFFKESKKYQLVWSEEFNEGDFPDKNRWNVITGNGCPENCGFGNNELQYYTNHQSNVRILNGHLLIEARADTIGNNYFTSGKLTTKTKGDWKTGRILVRAKLPKGTGTWPAIWMLPTLDRKMNWPMDGEIDIMEHVGHRQGWVFGTIHTAKYNHIVGTQKSDSIFIKDVSTIFHEYMLEWDEKSLRWFVDDQLFYELEQGNENKEGWPFDTPFHLILNLAVGGNFGGKEGVEPSAFPAVFVIDFVKVYQMN